MKKLLLLLLLPLAVGANEIVIHDRAGDFKLLLGTYFSIAPNSTTTRSLNTASVTTQTSGYTDGEANQSLVNNTATPPVPNITGSYTGTQFNVEFFLALAGIIMPASGPNASGSQNIVFTLKGYRVETMPAGTVNVTLSGGNFSSWNITITEKGKFYPLDDGSVESITFTSAFAAYNTYLAQATPNIFNLIDSVDVVDGGGGGTTAAPTLTMKTPSTNGVGGVKTAGVITFTSRTINPTEIRYSSTATDKVDIKKEASSFAQEVIDIRRDLRRKNTNVNPVIREDW